MSDNRCSKCQKLLFKGRIIEVEIKCPRCGMVNTMRAAEPLNIGVSGNEQQIAGSRS